MALAAPAPQWTRMRLLAAASGVSAFGSFLNMVVLGLFAFGLTGSALLTGLFMALRLGAGFLAGPVAGALAARLPRSPLMIACDLSSAAGLLLLVALPDGGREAWLYGLAVVLGVGQTVWGVAARSAVPDLAGQDGRVRANGLMVTCKAAATLLGFAAAGFVHTKWGAPAAFTIDAATYVVSAILLGVVRLGPAGDGGTPTAPWRSARAATALLAAAPLLAGMVALRSLDAFGSAAHNVGLPIYATIASPADPAVFASLFTAAWAAGNLGSSRLLGRFAGDGPGRAFAVGVIAMSVSFTLAFTGLPLVLLAVVGVAAGLADGFTEIAFTSRLQAAPGPERAHLLGFAATASYGGLGLGSVVCAAAMEAFPPLPVVAVAHGVPVLAALVFLVFSRRARGVPVST